MKLGQREALGFLGLYVTLVFAAVSVWTLLRYDGLWFNAMAALFAALWSAFTTLFLLLKAADSERET